MSRWWSVVLLAAVVASIVSTSVVIAFPHVMLRLAGPPAASGASSTYVSGHAKKVEPAAGTPAPAESPREPWWATLAGKVAWPFGLLGALALIGWNSRLRRLFGAGAKLVRKVSAGGIEMEISADAVDEIRDKLRGSFRELVGSARDEFERMADLQNVDRRLAAVVEKALVPRLASGKPSGLRATVHVRDIVFKDYLYQLIDYYPAGAGAHRRFSQRYGIIGRSWRSGKSHGTGNAFGTKASEDNLVEEWGMTRNETHGVLNTRPSCLSVLLRSGGIETGILYVDSTEHDAFGDDIRAQAFAIQLENDAFTIELAEAVERTLAPLRVGGPNLDLKDLGR
jgi:hypothetical protein